mmetsp:Transcript_41961/g.125632  ORF Transcript_41961/g.125632 Transcript_41961/m.125632 type:complete len:490 (+) Transcript_41961:747-2216(+)
MDDQCNRLSASGLAAAGAAHAAAAGAAPPAHVAEATGAAASPQGARRCRSHGPAGMAPPASALRGTAIAPATPLASPSLTAKRGAAPPPSARMPALPLSPTTPPRSIIAVSMSCVARIPTSSQKPSSSPPMLVACAPPAPTCTSPWDRTNVSTQMPRSESTGCGVCGKCGERGYALVWGGAAATPVVLSTTRCSSAAAAPLGSSSCEEASPSTPLASSTTSNTTRPGSGGAAKATESSHTPHPGAHAWVAAVTEPPPHAPPTLHAESPPHAPPPRHAAPATVMGRYPAVAWRAMTAQPGGIAAESERTACPAVSPAIGSSETDGQADSTAGSGVGGAQACLCRGGSCSAAATAPAGGDVSCTVADSGAAACPPGSRKMAGNAAPLSLKAPPRAASCTASCCPSKPPAMLVASKRALSVPSLATCASLATSSPPPSSSTSNTSCTQPRRTAIDRTRPLPSNADISKLRHAGSRSSGSRSWILIDTRTCLG